MSHRSQVLSLYRKVMRISRTWEVVAERQYILDELRTLVRRNRGLESPAEVAEKVQEFESRIVTGLHYKIPYPRPTNVAPGATGKDPDVVTPVYLHSYKRGTEHITRRRRAGSAPVYDDRN